MGIPQENILNLNKSRKRARYWREIGKGNWVQTSLLPADPASVNYYFLKGFKGKKPEGVPVEVDNISCPHCDFVAKKPIGLQGHLRKHKKEEAI